MRCVCFVTDMQQTPEIVDNKRGYIFRCYLYTSERDWYYTTVMEHGGSTRHSNSLKLHSGDVQPPGVWMGWGWEGTEHTGLSRRGNGKIRDLPKTMEILTKLTRPHVHARSRRTYSCLHNDRPLGYLLRTRAVQVQTPKVSHQRRKLLGLKY